MINNDFIFFVKKQGLITAFFNLGMWSLIVYRFGRYMYGKFIFKIFLVWYVYLFLKNILLLVSKIELPPTAKIGYRLNLVHAYGLVMGDRVIIGNDVTVGPWVVIGHNGVPSLQPIIGNGVYIGAKASLLGGIEIGDNVVIGPNTVLSKSVSANQIVKVSHCQILDTKLK